MVTSRRETSWRTVVAVGVLGLLGAAVVTLLFKAVLSGGPGVTASPALSEETGATPSPVPPVGGLFLDDARVADSSQGPRITLLLRNTEQVSALVTKVRLLIEDHFAEPIAGGDLRSTGCYKVLLPGEPSPRAIVEGDVSFEVEGGQADVFDVALGLHQHSGLTHFYKVRLWVVYNDERVAGPTELLSLTLVPQMEQPSCASPEPTQSR
jgi:hypothetical protein